MARSIARDHDTTKARTARPTSTADYMPEEMLAPILSGAYARGLADMLDLMQVPALFLSCDGRVLFANAPAHRGMSPGLRLEAQHLVAHSPTDQRVLDAFLAAVLGSAAAQPVAVMSGDLSIHAIDLRTGVNGAGQLVRRCLVFHRGGDPLTAALIDRMTGLRPGGE